MVLVLVTLNPPRSHHGSVRCRSMGDLNRSGLLDCFAGILQQCHGDLVEGGRLTSDFLEQARKW